MSTEIFGFTTILRAGAELMYERFHHEIPDALDRVMRQSGVLSWRIFRNDQRLTHEVEAKSRQLLSRQLDTHPINQEWQRLVGRMISNSEAAAESSAVAHGGKGHLVWDFCWPTRSTMVPVDMDSGSDRVASTSCAG